MMEQNKDVLLVKQSFQTNDNWNIRKIYYVSDLHLEYQLQYTGKNVSIIHDIITKKIADMISRIDSTCYPLLIGGDVSDSFEMTSVFYKTLLSYWSGPVIAVLGNHELWDAGSRRNQTVDEIVARYKEFAEDHSRLYILENDVLIIHNTADCTVVSEAQMLSMNPIEFWKQYSCCKYIVLGGIGFSGRNPAYNASAGIYQGKLAMGEDVERSSKISKLHEKVRLCAGTNKVVVLTHNPPQDWCGDRKCSNFIYVCGHNHRNHSSRNLNEPVILNDNQLGFNPCEWRLKDYSFEQQSFFDPLESLPEGVHVISASEYINFNQCIGIHMQSFSREGTIYAIKQDGAYLFLLQGEKLYILNGGSINIAEHSLSYYKENMSRYMERIREAFIPYDNEKKRLGREIKRLGGWGTDHGCIVDIDYWNHVYCNPYDGKLYFYEANNIIEKAFYKDFLHLVNDSSSLTCRELIMKRLETGSNIPALLPSINKSVLMSVAPAIVLDTEMYKPSRRMRSIQYLLEKKVIRIWRDEVLDYAFSDR